MTTTTTHYSAHTAILDRLHGVGLFVSPDPDTDVELEGTTETLILEGEPVAALSSSLGSLHWAAWDAAWAGLSREGWDTGLWDDDGERTGQLEDGRTVHLLYHADPIDSGWDVEVMVEALAELEAQLGVPITWDS